MSQLEKVGNRKHPLAWPLLPLINVPPFVAHTGLRPEVTLKDGFMLPIETNQKTMTLKEITDLLEVRHDQAMKKVAKMAKEPTFGTMFEIDIAYKGSQTTKTYQLDERQSIAVASMLNVALLMRVIDRWKELEEKQTAPQFQIPQTFAEAMQLAADQAKQLEIQAPKVAVYEMLADRKGDVSTTVVAKEIGITAIKLNRFLREKGVKWQKADLPKAGYESWFNVVADVKNGHEFTQCLVTPTGQSEIAKLWGETCH